MLKMDRLKQSDVFYLKSVAIAKSWIEDKEVFYYLGKWKDEKRNGGKTLC